MDNYNQNKNFSKSAMTIGEFLYTQEDSELHYTVILLIVLLIYALFQNYSTVGVQ